ncbi:MAG: substrate-binding domain-containing protein [Candidatus Omnitrophica bacterium]|nr:substrate-binding domain-containing protein [Candidatus Omnitrophota bacterium]
MKKLIIIALALSLLKISSNNVFAQGSELQGTLTLSGAWAIYPTAVAWAEGFQKKYPKVKIDVSAGGAGKGATDAITGLVDIGMVSREPDPAEIKKGITPVYILHDAVFAVINEKNPALESILKKGVNKENFIDSWVNGSIATWDKVAASKVNKPIHLFTRSDSCGAAQSWAGYLGKKQEDLKGIGVYGDPGILEAVKKDPIGIGYNNFSYVFSRDGALANGIRLVPIDSNENGKADADEIYTNRDEAVKAIRAGRYPATRRNYFFVKGKPAGLVREFILFALSEEGVKIVDEVGASLSLATQEREKVLKSLE